MRVGGGTTICVGTAVGGAWVGGICAGGVVLVELSIDGGLSWLPVDVQTGLTTAWTLHTMDLSAHRGYLISLRFTLSTAADTARDQVAGGWLPVLTLEQFGRAFGSER